jgi:hypothetical protein
MRRKWAKTALSCAERNGFVGSDESLSYSIRTSQQRDEEYTRPDRPMSAAASCRREKEDITSGVVCCDGLTLPLGSTAHVRTGARFYIMTSIRTVALSGGNSVPH